MPQRSVFCIAPSRGRADHAINDLKEANFSSTEISVLFLDRRADAGRATANTVAVESAGEIRGVMAWIAGIRPLVIPGVDPLIVAGPIAAALSGATVDDVAGGLIEFGVPREESARYAARIEDNQILVSVHSENPEKSDRAREILTAAGAEDILTIVEIASPATRAATSVV